ncbi:sensor histidine kinase [Rubrivirga sp. IMCC45206]|uniref:sensor histidine kinase n=1 Tax=Rubrivirga sp. IMCC45206 TaxID=3391614 RepID=UPI00398FB61B
MHALIHRLVPPTPGDDDAYHRGYLLVVACFLTGLISIGYAVLDAFAGFWVGTVVMSVVAVLFVGLPPLFRHTGSVALVAHLFLLVGTATVVINTHFAGGAEILPWLAVVPIAGALLMGRRAGAWWAALAMALAATFALLEANGYRYAVETDLQQDPVWVTLVRVGLPLIVYLLARVFQDERERALAALRVRNEALEVAMRDLQAAQQRLVQQEKLAGLGQVAAGIAHEIMNPLNFVANFSALNAELADELRAAVGAGDDGEVSELIDEIEANAGRVQAHSQRADAIVRAMLAHTRTGGGAHRAVDLNGLVSDEVARLGRAGEDRAPGAPVTVEVEAAPDAGAVEGSPEEIERALRNVLDNAVYAARLASPAAGGAPCVRVETAREDGAAVIRVSDNGPGVPVELRDRVFEPFFTTKPSGEGIGLGLSLSHEIVHARHGGTLAVEPNASGGATFVLTLPASERAPHPAPCEDAVEALGV